MTASVPSTGQKAGRHVLKLAFKPIYLLNQNALYQGHSLVGAFPQSAFTEGRKQIQFQ